MAIKDLFENKEQAELIENLQKEIAELRAMIDEIVKTLRMG